MSAAIVNAAELGLPPTLTATSNNDFWADELRVRGSDLQRGSVPWAKVTVPNDPALQGKTVRVRVTMSVIYPVANGNPAWPPGTTTR